MRVSEASEREILERSVECCAERRREGEKGKKKRVSEEKSRRLKNENGSQALSKRRWVARVG